MFLLIRYAKRPVVIAEMQGHGQGDIKRSIEESKPGFDQSKPVYLCMAGHYAHTAFKTVVMSAMSIEPDR